VLLREGLGISWWVMVDVDDILIVELMTETSALFILSVVRKFSRLIEPSEATEASHEGPSCCSEQHPRLRFPPRGGC
jgi:hypothetical protein